ncbi:hypothetical protein SAMN03097699_2923 [Flavobacteriaceae bacterium MAR_2010_188]|nr:hypothetical protein SAMN03097699_2923 [Flavobacteriaceae bacterium MAR_2010_188]
MKVTLLFLLGLVPLIFFGQQPSSNERKVKVALADTIVIDSVSINPARFLVRDTNGIELDSTQYQVDFAKSKIFFSGNIETDSIVIEYLRYPEFLTKSYSLLDENIIVKNTDAVNRLYNLSQPTITNSFTPFDGLTTSGSISRGVTIGNNQNSVLNSELDLQISGKLSDKVTLKASIQDANIPLQETGYSQRLDEFDQVFIEIMSEAWNIRAGDIDLINNNSYFSKFSKRVQGLLVNVNLDHPESETNLFASGALVRGQFTTSKFTAQEGNQGPYKLTGPNNELYVLIVSGSETVYVNGLRVERGENEDYIIDYNAGEIIFNSTFPITSEMRITVDYQFTDRNYSRFVAYGGGQYESEKLKLGVSVYSESDAKNQPLQQNLSTEQAQILANAGDEQTLMFAPSGTEEVYSENRILYRKTLIEGVEVYEFSIDEDEQLYSVKFRLVGTGNGDYVVANSNAVSTIYEYVSPVNGVSQGNYAPIVQLVAPVKLQVAVVNGQYTPSERTDVFFELAGSKNDLNLFSNLDDNDNDGFAGKLRFEQQIIKKDTLYGIRAFGDIDFIQDEFKSIQRIYNAEFNRDWNLLNPMGDQRLISGGLEYLNLKNGIANYNFQHLDYSENFNGNKHNFLANLRLGSLEVFTNSSILNSESDLATSKFYMTFNRAVYGYKKQWIGTKFAAEDNEERLKETALLTNLSQRFKSYEVFTGIGDSTAVFAEVGYKYRVNDSVRNNQVARVNSSNTFYLKSKIIQNEKTDLGIYINYRRLKWMEDDIEDENSLNSRLTFNQKMFNNILLWNTICETNSGTLPQQDFTYVQVEPGQGNYTWNDYNDNGVQELNEFEVAQFQDEGKYIRVLLPNRIFVKTHQNRFSQSLTINPQQWSVSDNASKKFWAHFYNQTSFLVDRKLKKEDNTFDLNPFNDKDDLDLALNKSLRNTLFFNRGKQNYTTSYTYLNTVNRTLYSIGFQENKLKSHQVNFNHKFLTSWLFNLKLSIEQNESLSENFANRNYILNEERIFPKISYLFSENARFDLFYQYTNKENIIGNQELLLQSRYGTSFTYNTAQQLSIVGEINLYKNDFTGSANTPISYQMLEGLQPGKNYTWSLLAQKKLTKFLDLNLNYLGRKTETSRTIHTGTVQLKAYF